MGKVAIVTDSIACLTKEMAEQYKIRIVPANICSGGEVFRDWVDISPSEAYELFLKAPEHCITSTASPAEYLQVYRELSSQAESILCVTISSKLSTMNGIAQVAREQAKEEFPRTTIEILDSQTCAAAEGFVALAAARAAKEGEALVEVIEKAKEVRGKVALVALLNTVRYIHRTGRIPKVAARAASILNIRPIFTIFGDDIHFAGIVRSRKHGVERILEVMKKKAGQNPVHVAVMHAYALDEAQKLRDRVSSEFNPVELWIAEFSPVMGYACGTGVLGLAFYSDS